MVTRETLEQMARDFRAELEFSAEDWESVLAQAQRLLEAIAMLDELPLETVEPAPIYKIVP